MKLSVEAKVAAAVAAGFIALTAAAIGQGGAEAQSGVPNNYGPINKPGVNTQMTEQAYKNSPRRTGAEVNGEKSSDEDLAGATSKSATKRKIEKPRRHHTIVKLSGTNKS